MLMENSKEESATARYNLTDLWIERDNEIDGDTFYIAAAAAILHHLRHVKLSLVMRRIQLM